MDQDQGRLHISRLVRRQYRSYRLEFNGKCVFLFDYRTDDLYDTDFCVVTPSTPSKDFEELDKVIEYLANFLGTNKENIYTQVAIEDVF